MKLLAVVLMAVPFLGTAVPETGTPCEARGTVVMTVAEATKVYETLVEMGELIEKQREEIAKLSLQSRHTGGVMGWLREAISDSDGMADIAYVSVLLITIGVLSSFSFICLMSLIAYFRCDQIVDVGQGVRAAVACPFDPQPIGIALGAIGAAFAAVLGALAGYMAATRRNKKQGE